MSCLRNPAGYPALPVDWSDYPDWVRERVVAKGFDPDYVVAIVLGYGALGETYVQKIDIGWVG